MRIFLGVIFQPFRQPLPRIQRHVEEADASRSIAILPNQFGSCPESFRVTGKGELQIQISAGGKIAVFAVKRRSRITQIRDQHLPN